MQYLPLVFSIAVLLAPLGSALGQGFINLNFESTTIRTVHFPGGDRYVATVPGWGPLYNFVDGGGDALSLNDIAMDSPAATLHDTNSLFVAPLQGSYSLLLQGGSVFYPGREGCSIGQTGQVPNSARSLLFFAAGPLNVTFHGQLLSAVPLSERGTYTVYGADITEYAGQTGLLTFARPWTGGNWSSGTVLDNIWFSPSVIPEPSIASLSAAGYILWTLSRRIMKNLHNAAESANHRPAHERRVHVLLSC